MFTWFMSRYDMRRRKLYVPDFLPQAHLEILLNRWIELYLMDTSMSLDRDGHSPRQIRYYEQERPVFFQKHGEKLLDYLRPYEAVPKNKLLTHDESRRTEALRRLHREAKKAESEQS